MTLPRLAIRRGVTFTMIYLMVLGFGLFSLSRLKLSLFPDVEFPIAIVMTTYYGAGPFDIETTVTRPIEQAVASVENIKRVSSRSQSNNSLVILEFNWGTDMEQAQTDLRRALEWLGDILPDDASNPLVFAFDPSQMPILFYGMSSPSIDQAEMRRIATETLGPRLERIEGVAAATAVGGLERQIRVEVDPRALASYGLSTSAVIGALSGANVQIPGGTIRDGRTAFSVRTLGEYRSIDEIRNTIVTNRGGQVIHVGDIADVQDSFREVQGDTRINRESGLVLIVRKQSDANTVQVVNRVLEQVPEIIATTPGNISLTPVFNQAEFITLSLSNLSSTAFYAFILTAIVLLIFLRSFQSSLVVAVAIPMSVVFTFFVMDMAGVTLNVISMAGLALAIGMLVDNSIVVLENIYRHRELGYSPNDAAEAGTVQVGMAITASTLTTVVIFLPILFVPGIAGVMFRDMVLSIVFALLASLMVALSLIPLLASRLLTRVHTPHSRIGKAIFDGIGNSLTRLENVYERALDWSLSHRKTIIALSTVAFIGSIGLVQIVGVDFLPKTDEGRIEFTVELQVGSDLPTTFATMKRIEDFVAENVPEAETIYSTIGSEGTMGNVFQGLGTNSGTMQVKLTRIADRSRSQFDIQDQIREFLESVAGIEYSFTEGGAMGSGSAIEVKVYGDDLDLMETYADRVVKALENVRGAVDVQKSFKRGAPELRIELDRARLQAVGLTAGQVTQAISYAIQGVTATQYREGGDEYDVFVRLGEQYRNSPDQVENLLISTPIGAQIPLRQIAKVQRDVSPVSISREDQSRMISVTSNISGRDLGGVVTDMNRELAKIEFPRDITYEIGGTAEDQQESFFYLAIALLAGIVLVYMVMATQFESLFDPFIIMVTIPLAFIGVALALFVTGTSLSVMAMIGMLVLVGIVVNNGIVLVDFTNQLRRHKGMKIRQAAREAGKVRMRPVLMTALTTIVGMIPLSLGVGESGETWAPLARAVIGGLIVSTVLTLVVVPVTYVVWERVARRIHRFRNWTRRLRGLPETEYSDQLTAEPTAPAPISAL